MGTCTGSCIRARPTGPEGYPVAMRIREAEPKDARAIAEIHVRSWQAAYRGQLADDYLDELKVEDRLEMHQRAL